MAADSQGRDAELAQALQGFWEDYIGVRPARVRVATGTRAIAVWLEQALSPAALQIASSKGGSEIIRELSERLLEQAKPRMEQLIEEAMERKGTLAEIHLDVASGSVLGFFVTE